MFSANIKVSNDVDECLGSTSVSTVHLKCKIFLRYFPEKNHFLSPNFCIPVLELSCLTASRVMAGFIFWFAV